MKLTLPILCSSMPTPTSIPTRNNKLVVILGATGAGKSRLSIDLATKFRGEIINSDKIQLYRGLEITTNKIPFSERKSIPHHLLGEFNSSNGDLSPTDYANHANSAITGIRDRGRLPFLVGGSISLIQALLSATDSSLCFLWVDVSEPILNRYLDHRVDEMLDSGMLAELERFYSGEIHSSEPNSGIRKAIGVPEFEQYFHLLGNDPVSSGVYKSAVRAIKENTRRLAKRQVEKIVRLRDSGWDLHRLDATDSFKGVLEQDGRWRFVWEEEVVRHSVKIVKRFLEE